MADEAKDILRKAFGESQPLTKIEDESRHGKNIDLKSKEKEVKLKLFRAAQDADAFQMKFLKENLLMINQCKTS